MKSYDVCECGAPLQLMERPTPKPTGTEVLLKVLAAGVCHCDLHIWDGYYDIGGGKMLKLADRGIKLPLTMGHENVGEVVARRPRRQGRQGGRPPARQSMDRLRRMQGVQARRRAALPASRRTSACSAHGGYATTCWCRIRAICSTSATLTPERAAPLACSGVTTYRRAEEGRPTLLQRRAGGHHRRRRARPDGRDAARQDGRRRTRSSSISIRQARRGASRPARPRRSTATRADAAKQITEGDRSGGAWAVIDFVGAAPDRAARGSTASSRAAAHRRRPVRRRRHDPDAVSCRCAP